MTQYKRLILQILIFAAAALMIAYGAGRGEVTIVFNKAVNVCLECIGLGRL